MIIFQLSWRGGIWLLPLLWFVGRMRGNGMCQMEWGNRRRIFLKMRRAGPFHSSIVFKVQVVSKLITSPRGEFLLVKCHALIGKLFCPDPMAGNVYVYDGLGFRSASLSNVAERN